MEKNPEYFNTNDATKLESDLEKINENDDDNGFIRNENIAEVLTFIKDNKLKGELRNKDEVVSTANCILANFEMATSAIHPGAAAEFLKPLERLDEK